MKTNYWDNIEENLQTIIDEVDTNNTYIWYALLWVWENEAKWKIQKIVKSWTITKIKSPLLDWLPTNKFMFAWNNRASITF